MVVSQFPLNKHGNPSNPNFCDTSSVNVRKHRVQALSKQTSQPPGPTRHLVKDLADDPVAMLSLLPTRRLVCISLPPKLIARLDERCEKTKVNRSKLMRILAETGLDLLDRNDQQLSALDRNRD